MDHTLVNEHIRWGIIVVTYMFLAGVGAGSLIVAVLPQLPWFFDRPALLRLRRAAIISAAACFVVVPLAVIADLGQPRAPGLVGAALRPVGQRRHRCLGNLE